MIDGLYIFLILFSYLLGSIPFGKIIAASYGIDIQKRGSGNIGFANVRRIVGWRAGIMTLAGDIIKGLLPCLIGLWLFGNSSAFLFGVCAILGHIFPIWLKFRGGKGIATGLGVVTVLSPAAALAGTVFYLIGVVLFRRSSSASLLGLTVTTLVAVSLSFDSWWQYLILVAIAVWALRHNIAGTVPNYDT